MTHGIDHNRRGGLTAAVEPLWQDFDLAASDARIIAELAKRVALWIAAESCANLARIPESSPHTLNEQTVRELLLVIDALTRRESARRAPKGGGRPSG